MPRSCHPSSSKVQRVISQLGEMHTARSAIPLVVQDPMNLKAWEVHSRLQQSKHMWTRTCMCWQWLANKKERDVRWEASCMLEINDDPCMHQSSKGHLLPDAHGWYWQSNSSIFDVFYVHSTKGGREEGAILRGKLTEKFTLRSRPSWWTDTAAVDADSFIAAIDIHAVICTAAVAIAGKVDNNNKSQHRTIYAINCHQLTAVVTSVSTNSS